MNARLAFPSPRQDHHSTSKHDGTQGYPSLRQIYSLRPRRAPGSDFTLRPVSPVVPSPEALMTRAHARADARSTARQIVPSSRPGNAYVNPAHPSDRTRGSFDQAAHSSSRARPEETFPAPPSLSVYDAPTATYYWPNLAASSQMRNGPVLYATYHDMSSSYSSDSDDSQSGSEDRSPPHSRYHGQHSMLGPNTSTLRSPAPSRHSSVEISPLKSPVNRSMTPGSRASSVCSTSSDHPPVFDIGYPPRQDHRSSFAVSPASQSASGSRRPSPSIAHSASDRMSPEDSGYIPTQPPPAAAPEWESHAVQIRNPEGRGVAYQCTWMTSEGPCHYWSKKQLVKRHVETTHLKFKPFVCDICSKAFPQKTSLEIHRHGHTGDTPHQCNYCSKSFKDPARRHRHHVEVHGYIPKQGKRKQHPTGGVQGEETSPYESFPPIRMHSDTNSASSRG
ncbi:hypothetical protein C8R47DRAFT_543191 [Mycena vitilis]|nr:hypothetical protein C8R47DRAFT_543191 [Mycena vitilis]